MDELALKLDALNVPTLDEVGQKFLKLDATAANAIKLGGLSAGQFVQGGGSVLSNALVTTDNTAVPLLSAQNLADIEVATADNGTGRLVIENTGGQALSFVVDTGTALSQGSIAPGDRTRRRFSSAARRS